MTEVRTGGASRRGNAAAHPSAQIKNSQHHGREGGMPHGFVSKAQMRYFFANPALRRYAKREAHKAGMHSEITKAIGHSPAYDRLPEHVSHGVPTQIGGPSSLGRKARGKAT